MKTKKIIIAVVAILVILGGTFAGLWFFTDVLNFLKPEKEAAAKTVEKSEEAIDLEKALNLEGARFSNYSEFLANKKDELLMGSYKSNLNLTANLKISDLDSSVQDIINSSKITLKSSLDAKNEKAQNIIGLYSNNSEVLKLDTVTNGTTIGVGCTDLYDKYLTISLEDLAEYLDDEMDSYEIESLIEAVSSIYNPSQINPYELLYISDEDLQHFDEVYRDGYVELIPAKSYSTKKDVDITVNGKEVSTKAYYVTLNGKQCYDFISGFGDKIKNDSVLTRVITEKINMILEASGEDKIREKDVQEFIDELVDEMLEEFEEIQDYEDSAIQIAVYTSDDKLVRVDINSIEDTDDMDDVETLLSFEFSDSKNTFTLYENGKAYIFITNDITKNSDEEAAGSFKISVNGSSIATLNYDIVDKDDKSKVDLSISVPLAGLNASIQVETEGDITEEEVKIKGSVSFAYGKESIKVNFDGTIEYTDDVSVPSFTSSNSVDVLSLSDDELKTEMTKIMKKASEVLPERLKLIGINVKAEDIYTDPNSKPATSEEDVDASTSTEETENTDSAA